MLVGTHALLPVCGCLVVDCMGVAKRGERVFSGWALTAVGVFGVLPDLCSPHICLQARHTSSTHSLWFLLLSIIPALGVGQLFRRRKWLVVAVACWLATMLHGSADALSGGIAWLYPWRAAVVGGRWVPFEYWIWSDVIFVLWAWFLNRALKRAEARSARVSQQSD